MFSDGYTYDPTAGTLTIHGVPPDWPTMANHLQRAAVRLWMVETFPSSGDGVNAAPPQPVADAPPQLTDGAPTLATLMGAVAPGSAIGRGWYLYRYLNTNALPSKCTSTFESEPAVRRTKPRTSSM